jgi:transposase-like protein
MAEHLGYEKHDQAGRNSGNSRNGTRAKTVLTEIGPVEIEVSRDTESTFEAQIVKKRQRRLTGVDEIVLSLTARGLTTGEIAAHFQEVYGARVSKDTISRITEKVTQEMTEWLNRPLDEGRFPVIVVNSDRKVLQCHIWRGIRPRRTRSVATSSSSVRVGVVRLLRSGWVCRSAAGRCGLSTLAR